MASCQNEHNRIVGRKRIQLVEKSIIICTQQYLNGFKEKHQITQRQMTLHRLSK